MNELRIIIAGSRDFNDFITLNTSCVNIINTLSMYNTNITIISGGARGADKLGEQFATFHKYKLVTFPAEWEKFGKRAGFIRNAQMAEFAAQEQGILIAFWDGKSKGTKHMIDTAQKYGLKTYIVNY